MEKRDPKGIDQFIAFNDDDEEIENIVIKTQNRKKKIKYPMWVPEEKRRKKFPYEGSMEQQITEELKDFCIYMKPTESEKKMRKVKIFLKKIIIKEDEGIISSSFIIIKNSSKNKGILALFFCEKTKKKKKK